MIAAAESRRETAALEPGGRGRCVRVALVQQQRDHPGGGLVEPGLRRAGRTRTAATIPSRAARGSGGISSTSSPASARARRRRALPNRSVTAAICSESVNATPRKPSRRAAGR